MLKELGEVKIIKSHDYYEKIVKALEKAGFSVVVTSETTYEKHYIVAEESED